MKADNFEGTLRALQRKSPFQPFAVDLINGERVEVYHPEALVVRGNLAVHFDPQNRMTIFDHEGVARVVTPLKREVAA